MKPPAISCSMPFLSAQSSAISRGKLGSRFLFFSFIEGPREFSTPFLFFSIGYRHIWGRTTGVPRYLYCVGSGAIASPRQPKRNLLNRL